MTIDRFDKGHRQHIHSVLLFIICLLASCSTDRTDETYTCDTLAGCYPAQTSDTASGETSDTTAPEDMVLIPAGAFLWGCNSAEDLDCAPDESPSTQVYLDAFYIDRTEVTVNAYNACVNAGTCALVGCGAGDDPITCVDWFHAETFCTWANKKLPTEAQWEKAARGTDGQIYPWGNETPSCTYAAMHESFDGVGGGLGCGTGKVLLVGSKPAGASPYGVLDMAGNVYEWTADWYGSYSENPSANPTGPASGEDRIFRGGSYGDNGTFLRASARYYTRPQSVGVYHGFRCAKSAAP